MKAIILAGGKGTRLGLNDLPKPMVPVLGKPLLELQTELLKSYNITDIIILSGYMADKIEAYFGNGEQWSVNITHVKEQEALGTAGALKQLEGILNERFLLLYGDVMMDFDINSFIAFDKEDSETIASIIIHPNDHPYDSDLVVVDKNNYVKTFLSKPHAPNLVYSNNVNAAVYLFSPDIFSYIEPNISSDFGKDIFPKIVTEGKKMIRAYSTPEYIKDLGTPDRLEKVERDLSTGLIGRKNKKNKQKAIFIDRDGVINEEVGNLSEIEKFKILPDVAEAIKLINKSDYLAIVITNQPVIAKGWISEENLWQMHKKLETILGEDRAFIDKIYYCPHHPDKGFDGEIEDLKIDCECRKPKIGMINKAALDFNIDLEKSYIVGDTTTDIQTGINANIKTILVNTGYAGSDKKYSVKPDWEANNLLDAVQIILAK
jgi:mannose-1-phosphate guanylyltransferase / phosphomannomutase